MKLRGLGEIIVLWETEIFVKIRAEFSYKISQQPKNSVSASTDQDSDQDTDQDETAVKKLLGALGKETLSANELMHKMGLSHKPTFRKNYLRPALNRGLIEATLPDKPTSRYQKYRKKRKEN